MIGISTSNVRLGGSLASNGGMVIALAFQDRVIADGGTFEALGCLINTINMLSSLNQIATAFDMRVVADSGVFESINCLQTQINSLS